MANRAALIRLENEGKNVTRRGKNFIEFDLGNGVTRHVATIEPLHYGAQFDQEIDTAWEADTGAWQWRIVKNDHLIHSRNIFNVGSLFEWRIGEQWVIIDPQSINWINQDNSRQQIAIKQAVTGVPDDDVMSFTNAYGSGRHYKFTAHPKRLIKHIIIDSPSDLPAPTITGTIHFEAEFSISNSSGIELYLDGVRWARANNVRVRTANRIEFRDDQGVVQWYADAPTAYDSSTGPQRNITSCQYEVRRQGGSYFITVRVPKTWIDTATFPITIDPTFTDGYGGDVSSYIDTMILAEGPTTNYGTDTKVVSGNWDTTDFGKGRTLIKFDLSSITEGATVTSATLSLWEFVEYANNTRTHGVYRVLRAW